MDGKQPEKREQLIRDGYCTFEGVVDEATIARLNEMSEWTIAQEVPEHFERRRSQGCIISYAKYPHPAFTEIIADPRALAVLSELGFAHPRVWSGYLISKPPGGPPLFWHQDGPLWGHPIAYTDRPQLYFLMWYLVDTSRENGCLRLIPGSHLKRHPMHDVHTRGDESVSRAADLAHPAFSRAEGEVDVPVKAGDLVIGDSRLLHSAHANSSDRSRTVLTIWYWPDFDDLPEECKAYIAAGMESPEWSTWIEQNRATADFLIPRYHGDVQPLVRISEPGPELK